MTELTDLERRNSMKNLAIGAVILLGVSACAQSNIQDDGFLREVPDAIVAQAGPNQNLARVALLETDGCLWYEHVGPVETTLLPLLSKGGRHMCTAREDETETDA